MISPIFKKESYNNITLYDIDSLSDDSEGEMYEDLSLSVC